jgi:hypothetical protein
MTAVKFLNYMIQKAMLSSNNSQSPKRSQDWLAFLRGAGRSVMWGAPDWRESAAFWKFSTPQRNPAPTLCMILYILKSES